MSEDLHEGNNIVENVSCCKQCGKSDVEEGYKLKLCKECRDYLLNRPVPMKIKVFLIILTIITLFSLTSFPKTLQSGIEYERGIKAENSLKYVSAMKNYEKVIKDYPNSEKTLVKLYNAYYRNEKIDDADKTLTKIIANQGSSSDLNKGTTDEVNSITNKIDLYYSVRDKELYSKLNSLKNPKPEELVATIKPYVDDGTEPTFGAYMLADSYFDLNKFGEIITLLNDVTDKYPDYYLAILLKAAAYRELGMYDEGINCCNEVLKQNSEDINAFVALSKIELKRKNNAEGLKYAQKAYELDSSSAYAISNLALAYHYNNKIKERDEMFNKFKNSSDKDEYTLNLLNSIFSGSLQWQK